MMRGWSGRPNQIGLPKAARLAVAVVFFIGGAGIANWAVRIPAIQQKLNLSNSDLGLALLGIAVGAILAMLTAGWLIARVGSRLVAKLAVLAYCFTLPLPTLALNLPLLIIALLLVGIAFGTLDVAMNAQAIAIEQRYHRPIMSSFHGLYSVGGMTGVVGGLLASLGVDPTIHLCGTALLLGIVAVLVSPQLLSTNTEGVPTVPRFILPPWSLVSLGIIAFCIMLSEGAMTDWSAVYLHGTLKTGPGLAAAGYTVFSLAMAVCRFMGDRLTQRLGSVRMIRFGSTFAAAGLSLSLVIANPFTALIGFGCVGVGLSSLVPIVFSAAGRTPGIPPSLALAAVTTIGYGGLLCGPPLIGFVADFLNLRIALGIVVCMSVISAVLAGTTQHDVEQFPNNS